MSITIKFSSPEEEAAFKAQAQAAGVSAEEYARRALDQVLTPAPAASEEGVDPDESIGEMIRRIVGDVPEEELAGLLKDGASDHDHYIYGWPKRNP